MSEIRPLRSAAAAVVHLAPGLAPRAEKLMWRSFYELASMGRRDLGAAMMNYGYAPLDDCDLGEIADESRDDRYGLALYRAVAADSDLDGADVLEVGCGRGGGADFLFRTRRPRSMTGLDLARKAIARCERRYARPGLRFVAGDAESLPFPDEAFDVVLSVESSHCYGQVARFWSEAYRVLRPGGRLLLADFRHTETVARGSAAIMTGDSVADLRGQVREAGFELLEEQDITANVVRALELDTPVRLPRIEQRVPKLLRPHALAFAAVQGSPMYAAFADADLTYLRFVLEK